MYAPASFRNTDRETAWGLIEQVRLGTVFTGTGGLEASPLPFMIDRDQGPLGRLVGHCARANPQCESLDDGTEVLVSFLGPHAYVSPGWYGTHPRAPTWLYASVQVRGTSRLVDVGATQRVHRLMKDVKWDQLVD
jgi:transcriptional regulator